MADTRISLDLATEVARATLTERYRQVEWMTTRDLVLWLKQRGVALEWRTLHHLWQVGILRPIAVLDPAVHTIRMRDPSRFETVELGFDLPTYLDLGPSEPIDPAHIVRQRPKPGREWADSLQDALVWHPFQAWTFHGLVRALHPHWGLDLALGGMDAIALNAPHWAESVSDDLARFPTAATNRDNLLALLLRAEPLVHTDIDTHIYTRPHLGESFDGYFEWRTSEDGANLLNALGITVEDVLHWFEWLARDAHHLDPVAEFRRLLRHVKREKRILMRGDALRAHDLYDLAEILRRYLERYHRLRLPEEDDVVGGDQAVDAKRTTYGSARTADYNRGRFRLIAREFGLDPQVRLLWYIEGPTESGLIPRIASGTDIDLEAYGIRLVNLRGTGNADQAWVHEQLEHARAEELFTFMSLDADDRGDHLRAVRNYAHRNELTAGFAIWDPDVEAANFTVDELAAIANEHAGALGTPDAITRADIATEQADAIQRGRRRLGVGNAIVRLLERRNLHCAKGQAWGEALGDWAVTHTCPAEVADAEGRRPILSVLRRIRDASRADYAPSVRLWRVDESGNLTRR